MLKDTSETQKRQTTRRSKMTNPNSEDEPPVSPRDILLEISRRCLRDLRQKENSTESGENSQKEIGDGPNE